MDDINSTPGSEPLIPSMEQSPASEMGNESPEAAPGQQAPSPANDWNPQEYELNYRGQKVYPKDRQHLMALAQQGYGAAQTIEQYKRQQSELEQMRGQYSTYEKLDGAFKQHPQFAQKIQQMLAEYQSNPNGFGAPPIDGEQAQGNFDPRIHQLSSKLEELEQWRSQALQSEADQRVKSEIDQLKSKYSDQDWNTDNGYGTLQNRILKHALDKGLTDIELAYKDYMWDNVSVQARAQALKQAKDKQQQQHRQGVVQGGGQARPAPGKVGYQSGDSYNDLTQKAMSLMAGR